jgi:iron complex transport system substrate-binding protein
LFSSHHSRAAVLALLVVLGACGAEPDRAGHGGIEVTDGTGQIVRLGEPARRVVSLMPPASEWIVAMGAADRLVARTDYDRAPALQHLPSAGGGLSASVEWLAARRPDLVIAWPDGPTRSLVSRLSAMRIPVYAAGAETIDEALVIADALGRLLGREAAADSAVAVVRSGLAAVERQVQGRPAPSVLFLIGMDPLTASGPGTFVDQLVRAAGGRNVLADLTLHWPPVSLEEVVRRDPDIILVGTVHGVDVRMLRERPGWRTLSAVRSGRVHSVDPDVVNRWGPHLHESAGLLADLIHGAVP